MDTIIQSLGFTASDNLQSFVKEQLDKLHGKDSIVRANVTLFQGPAGSPENQYCEIRLEVPGNDHFAKRSGETLEKAVLDTVEVLQKIMRRTKEKLIDRRQSGGLEPEAF